MGYASNKIDGAVAWGSSNNFCDTFLDNMSETAGSVSYVQNQEKWVNIGQKYESGASGLKSATATISGKVFATPKKGVTASMTWSGQYQYHLHTLSLVVEWAVDDMTGGLGTTGTFTNADSDYMYFRPGAMKWSGTLSCYIDTANSLNDLPDANGATGSLTITLNTGVTLAGSAILTQLNVGISESGSNTADYSFEGIGTLTPAGASNPFGTSELSAAHLWDQDDTTTNDTTFVLTTSSGKTHTMEAWLSRASLNINQDTVMTLDLDLQVTGPWVIA